MKGLRFILVFTFYLFANQVFGLNYYWVGGSGNWSDINHWSAVSGNSPMQLHTITPTSADNVILDSLSFPSTGGTITINLNIVFCKNLIIQNIPSNVTIQFAGGNRVLRIFGDIDINDTLIWNGNGLIKLEGLGSHTLRAKGITLPNLFANSVGSTWTVIDSIKVNRLHIENGTFNCKGSYIEADSIQVWNSSFLNVDSTELVVSRYFEIRPNAKISCVNGGLTFIQPNACYKNKSQDPNSIGSIEFRETTGNFNPVWANSKYPDKNFTSNSNCHIQKLILHKDAWLKGDYLLDTLSLDSALSLQIHHSSNPTINFIKTSGSCSSPILISSEAVGFFSSIIHGTSQDTCSNLKLNNIHILDSTLFLVNSLNINNASTGISVLSSPSSQSFYWINGSGNWDDPAHWSHTPNGGPTSCIPSIGDTVYFTSNSGTSNININLPTSAPYISSLYSTNNPTISFTGTTILNISGTLSIDSNFNLGNMSLRFIGTDSTNFIRTSGNFINKLSFINSGHWILQDDITCNALYHIDGTLNVNHRNILSKDFQSDRSDMFPYINANPTIGSPTLIADSSVICSNYFRFNSNYSATTEGAKLVILAGTPLFHNFWPINDPRGIFSAQNITWDTILVQSYPTVAAIQNILNCNVFIGLSDIVSNNQLNTDSTYFSRGNSYTLKNFNFSSISANGDCGNYIDFQGYQNAAWNWNANNLSHNLSYCIFKDINVNNGQIIASNSFDNFGNTGIVFSSTIPRTLYWVGGSGNWSDSTHWSLLSGGVGGACIPTPVDSVVFDSLSGSISDITIPLTNPAYCEDIYVSSNCVKVRILGNDYLTVYGNVDFHRTNTINLLKLAAKKKTALIRTKFSTINELVIQGDSSNFLLQDSLGVSAWFYHRKGTLIGNGNYIYCGWHYYGIGDSLINPNSTMKFVHAHVSNYWNVNHSEISIGKLAEISGNVNSKSATFDFYGSTGELNFSSPDSLSKVRFRNSGFFSQNGPGRVKHMFFEKNGTISTDALLDTLIFSNGYTYYLPANKEVSVTSYFDCDGDFCNPILIRSTTQGVQTNINLGDTLSGNFLEIRDLKSTGTGPFYAGIKSADQGNNSNLIWANKPGYVWGFGPDKYFITCNGSPNDSVTLYTDGFEDAIGFTWFDGSTGSTYKTNQEGMYWVEASYGGCSVIDTIVVIFDTVSFDLPSNFICVGDTVKLSPVRDTMSALVSLLWNDGSTDFKKTLVFTQDTTIWVQVTNTLGHTCVDTVHLSTARLILPDSIHLLNCKYPTIDTSFVLDLLPAVPDSIYFSLSQPFDSIGFTYHGWVHVLAQFCSTIELDSVYVSLDSAGSILPNKTSFCLNSPVPWSTNHPNSAIPSIWMGNASFTSNTYLDTIYGNGMVYFHRTDDAGCTCGDTLEYMLNQTVSVASSGISQNIMGPYLDTLQGFVFGDGNAYRWYVNNSLVRSGSGTFDTLSIHLNTPGTFTYSFVGIDTVYGCLDSTSFTIVIASVPPSYFPTSFTPNGDGINDLWVPMIWTSSPQTVDLKIYDKWGFVVYQSYSNKVAWDGNDPNGNGCEDGAYLIECKYLDLLGNWQQYQGWILVIRP